MDVSKAKRLKALEEENTNLEKQLADAMLDNVALKIFYQKNNDPRCQARGRRSPSTHAWDERAAGEADQGFRQAKHDGMICGGVQGDRLRPNDGALSVKAGK
jgi:hypothetical protein